MDLAIRKNDGGLRLNFHKGQKKAWHSPRRFIFVVAGTQSGKTSFGPWWLHREIVNCGPGDYLAVTATYDLFKLKMLPEMLRVFVEMIGGWIYQASDRVLTDGKSRIILRSANAPGGLESATVKAAWLDECGQDEFSLSAWEAVQRRLSLSQGRVLGTTTPYNLGWLKTEVYDRWRARDLDYHVIQFKSTMNPAFPREEFERAERILPRWKFLMFYCGEFARPAGMIYDCFDDAIHVIRPFVYPERWPKYGGLDFGGVHTAAVGYAENPETKALYLFREYLEGGRTAKQHTAELQGWGCRVWAGGSKSEDQWRDEFSAAGLPMASKDFMVTDVEVGINRVYGCHKRNEIFVFDTCRRYLDQKGRYSRELDDFGQPTEKIKDKDTFHFMDAERYIISYIRGSLAPLVGQPVQQSKWNTTPAADGESRWKRM